jgi:DNA-binding HxlR family transcriptional regulator
MAVTGDKVMTNELEKLKAENKRFKETLDDLFKVQYKLADNCKKLRQTLAEIKEIAEAHKKDESVWNPYRQLDKILQKISECEGNDEKH